MHDLFNAEHLHDKVEASLHQKNQILVKLYNRRAIDVDQTTDELLKLGERLKPYVANTGLILNKALDEGKTVLFEGAQATMLDVDHGTYPFVTSSNPTAGGACTGTGVGPTKITRVVGVSKAYVTRVGEGPFPTELFDESGEWLRQQGHEFGVTTGRPRRCGWFDAVVNRYATTICRRIRPPSLLPSRFTRPCPAGPRTFRRSMSSTSCPPPARRTSSVLKL